MRSVSLSCANVSLIANTHKAPANNRIPEIPNMTGWLPPNHRSREPPTKAARIWGTQIVPLNSPK